MKKRHLVVALIVCLGAFWGCSKKNPSGPGGGSGGGGGGGGGVATIFLTSPKGGETWTKGSKHTITWAATGLSTGALRVDFSKDGGATWDTVPHGSGLALTLRSLSWAPEDTTHKGLVRVSDMSGSQILARDSSHADFTVSFVSNFPYVVDSVGVDAGPYGVAVTPDGNFAYVTCSGAGLVDVISTASDSVVAKISGFNQPQGVAISPNGSYAYVTDNLAGTVSVISTATHSIIKSIPTNGYPFGVTVSPDGRLIYVVHSSTDFLTVIDAATNTVLRTVSGAGFGVGIAVRPTGRYVYSTKSSGAVFSVLDTVGFAFTTYPLNGKIGSSGIAFLPSGSEAYIANSSTNNVSVVTASPPGELTTITVPGEPAGVAMGLGGNYVYVTQASGNSLAVINTGNQSIATTLSGMGIFPLGLAVTPSGKNVYVAANGSNTVYVVYTNGF